ncbi:MAG: YybH family protein [Burkholderiaceae bacterium]
MHKTAPTPEECNRMLLAALESGDIDTSVALYEPSAVLFRKSGQAMTGYEEIRKNNAFLIDLKPKFTIEFIKTTLSGDGTIATNRMKASMVGTNSEGRKIEGQIHTLEVLRKQADGSWRYIIDDPYGSMRAGMEER